MGHYLDFSPFQKVGLEQRCCQCGSGKCVGAGRIVLLMLPFCVNIQHMVEDRIAYIHEGVQMIRN